MRGWPKKWGKTKLAPKWFILVQILDITDSNVKIKISYWKMKIMNVDKIKKILPFIKEEEKAEENDIDNLNFWDNETKTWWWLAFCFDMDVGNYFVSKNFWTAYS